MLPPEGERSRLDAIYFRMVLNLCTKTMLTCQVKTLVHTNTLTKQQVMQFHCTVVHRCVCVCVCLRVAFCTSTGLSCCLSSESLAGVSLSSSAICRREREKRNNERERPLMEMVNTKGFHKTIVGMGEELMVLSKQIMSPKGEEATKTKK